jgi:hypothetical protein
MGTNSTQDEKKLHELIINALESLYGEANCDKYFLVRSTSVNIVRSSILEKVSDLGVTKEKLDLLVTISRVGSNVFIKV